MSVYVSKLSGEINENELKEKFSEYGSVKRVQLSINHLTGERRGFAFLEMATDIEESSAINGLLGSDWIVRSLKKIKAINRLETSASPWYLQRFWSH